MRYSLYVESPSFLFMCLENIKWNSNLLGNCFFSPLFCFFLVFLNLVLQGSSLMLMELGVCGPSAQKFSTEHLCRRLAHHQKLKLDKPWAWGISSPFWTASFWPELDPRASCTQRQGKFASGVGFQVLSMLDFSPAPLWTPLYHCAVALTGKTEIL